MLDDVEKGDHARAERKPRQDFGSVLILRKTMSLDARCFQAFYGNPRRVDAGNGRDSRGSAGVQKPSSPGAVVDDAGEARDVPSKELDEASRLPDSRRPKGFEEGAVVVLLVIVDTRAASAFVNRDTMAAGAAPADDEAGRRD